MSKSKLTYASAIAGLEKIVKEIESGEVDVDALVERVKKASELIRFCRSRLRETQQEVDRVISDIGDDRKSEGT